MNDKLLLLIIILHTRNLLLPTPHWEQNWICSLERGHPTFRLRLLFPSVQGSSWFSSLAQETKINLLVKCPSPGAAAGVARAILVGLTLPALGLPCLAAAARAHPAGTTPVPPICYRFNA